MAFTVTNVVTHCKCGDFVMRVADVTVDAATGVYNPGIGFIHFAMVTPKALVSTAQPKVKLNEDASGAVSTGVIALSGAVTSNVYTIVTFAKQG